MEFARRDGCTPPSLDIDHLQIKDQCRVCGDPRLGFISVGEVCGNGDAALAAGSHALDTDVPAFDHLAGAEGELEGFAGFVG